MLEGTDTFGPGGELPLDLVAVRGAHVIMQVQVERVGQELVVLTGRGSRYVKDPNQYRGEPFLNPIF